MREPGVGVGGEQAGRGIKGKGKQSKARLTELRKTLKSNLKADVFIHGVSYI